MAFVALHSVLVRNVPGLLVFVVHEDVFPALFFHPAGQAHVLVLGSGLGFFLLSLSDLLVCRSACLAGSVLRESEHAHTEQARKYCSIDLLHLILLKGETPVICGLDAVFTRNVSSAVFDARCATQRLRRSASR